MALIPLNCRCCDQGRPPGASSASEIILPKSVRKMIRTYQSCKYPIISNNIQSYPIISHDLQCFSFAKPVRLVPFGQVHGAWFGWQRFGPSIRVTHLVSGGLGYRLPGYPKQKNTVFPLINLIITNSLDDDLRHPHFRKPPYARWIKIIYSNIIYILIIL